MKEVLLKSIYAGPTQTAGPNTVITVEDHQAAELVAGGYAVLVRLVPVEEKAGAGTDEGGGEEAPANGDVTLSTKEAVVAVKGKTKKSK